MRTAFNSFNELNGREKLLTLSALVGVSCYILYSSFDYVATRIEDHNNLIRTRLIQLDDVNSLLKRYDQLNKRFKKAELTFSQSQMTFEQVTSNLDQLIKESIGSDKYDLSKTRAPSEIGLEYEKQEFTVRLKSINREQLIKVLYQLEHGGSPLFLGKVELTRSQTTGDITANLEVFSIRKKN